jgi:hypothetical protein
LASKPVRPTPVLALLLLALAAGCLDGDGPGARDDPAAVPEDAGFLPDLPDVAEAPVPPGCDRSRPVVLHKAGGALASGFPGPRPVSCYHDAGDFVTFEPAIGVLSDGTVYIGPGQEAFSTTAPIGVLRTRDQGATWELVFPDVAGTGVPSHQTTLDPYLFTDPMTDRTWAEDLSPAVNVAVNSWTDDGGADTPTWTTGYAGGMQFDHVTVFTGPPVTSPTLGYPNVVYRCSISGGALAGASTLIVCQRSLDGGLTWLPHGEPAYTFLQQAIAPILPGVDTPLLYPCWSGNGHGAAAADGRIYLPRGHCGQPFLAWSDDEGLTWTRTQVSDLGVTCAPADGLCEHDAGFGIDADGTLYFAWVAADHLLYLTRSTDEGATWDTPQVVSAPGMNEVTHVQLAAGAAGRIALVYYATRNSPGVPWADGYEETTWDTYMAVSYDAGEAVPTFATVQLNDAGDPMVRHQCGPVRCDGVFDYIDLRIGPDGAPWAPLVDACTGPCVEAADELNNDGQAAGGRLWNVDLWDATDPNGHFP